LNHLQFSFDEDNGVMGQALDGIFGHDLNYRFAAQIDLLWGVL